MNVVQPQMGGTRNGGKGKMQPGPGSVQRLQGVMGQVDSGLVQHASRQRWNQGLCRVSSLVGCKRQQPLVFGEALNSKIVKFWTVVETIPPPLVQGTANVAVDTDVNDTSCQKQRTPKINTRLCPSAVADMGA